jgi:hypothetical protein
MPNEHDAIDQQLSSNLVLFVNHPFGQDAVGPETGGNKEQQAGPEQEAALPFQTGLAQSAFYGPVRHDFHILRELSTICQRKRVRKCHWLYLKRGTGSASVFLAAFQ